MPTTAGIPLGPGSTPLVYGQFTPQQLAQAFIPGTAAAAAASASPQAATQAAFRAAQTGFATAAWTQLYPGPTSVPGVAPQGMVGNRALGTTPDIMGRPVVLDWMDRRLGTPDAGLDPQAIMRGKPVAFSWWQQKPPNRLQTTPQPVPVWLQSRPYDRGAAAYAPHFGQIPSNPIGAGVYAPYRIPTIAGPGARYVFGAIWFDVQSVPTSIRINPTIPIETMNALIMQSRVGGTYLTTG